MMEIIQIMNSEYVSSVLKNKLCPGWVAALVEASSRNQKVAGSMPSQGTYLGCWVDPWSGRVQEATDWCFSLTLTLPSSLFKKSINISSDED